MNKQSYRTAFLTMVCLFFFWGFVAASNGVLIPLFKRNFQLSQFESQLVDSAFFAAYFVGSLIYFSVSFFAGDPLNKIGYKKGLILGLLISAIGSLLFIPAVNASSYSIFLIGLFTIGLGFALLQIVANPFIINMGDVSKGSNRLNLAGGINSLGTTIGPVILAYALYGKVNSTNIQLDISNVKIPYAILSSVLIAIAILITIVKMPEIKNEDVVESKIGAFKYAQLVLGMIAIFVYVGVEVTIPSNLSALLSLEDIKGIDPTRVDKYISLYWGSLMIGRISSSLKIFNIGRGFSIILSIIIPFAVFGLILGVNSLRGTDVTDLLMYTFWLILFIVIKTIGEEKPAKTLVYFSSISALLILIGLLSNGDIALFSIIGTGLFLSVMWPCIFNLAIAGLGKYTNQASSLLIMMILGGAIIPPLQGKLADLQFIGIHTSYWVPFLGFIFLLWYGYRVKAILLKQGIDYDKSTNNEY